MVAAYIPKPDIPETLGWKHEATDWVLSEDPDRKNVVADSRADTENLLSYVFDVDLDPEKTYYVSARVICNKGIFEWSKAAAVKVVDFIKMVSEHPIPSYVNKPVIEHEFDNYNYPNAIIHIRTSPMSSTSNTNHRATTLILETIDNHVVESRISDTENLTEFVIDKMLRTNMPYIINVSHESDSNDVSDFAKDIIFVKDIPEIRLKSDLANDDISDGYTVVIDHVEDMKGMNVVMYAVDKSNLYKFFEGSTDKHSLVIPREKFTMLDKTQTFLLGIEVVYENDETTGFKYYKVHIPIPKDESNN